MGYKSIVLSVKHQGRVRSWEATRAAPAGLLSAEIFEDLPASGLLSDEPSLSIPMLGDMERQELVPGTSGWIGVDADRRQIIDFQQYCDLGAYQVALDASDSSASPEMPDVPAALVRACLGRPWRAKAETSSSSLRATRYAPSKTHEQWEHDLRHASSKAWRDAVRQMGRVDIAWMVFQPDLPPAWRLVDCHPTGDPARDARAALRVMALLEKNGWGWHEGLRQQWEVFALDRVMACPQIMAANSARRAARDLSGRLPASSPSPSFAPRL